MMAGEQAMITLQRDVEQAKAALLREARERPEWWDPRDLREKARDALSGDVMMYALTDLVNQGDLVLDEQLHVKIADAA
jgi:hypothetical protein